MQNNTTSLVGQANLIKELFLNNAHLALSDKQQSEAIASISSLLTVILGEDRAEIPAAFSGIKRLQLLPLLTASGYHKMAMAMIKHGTFTFNTGGSRSDMAYVQRILQYGTPEVIDTLFEQSYLLDQMIENASVYYELMSSIAMNCHEGMYMYFIKLNEQFGVERKKLIDSLNGGKPPRSAAGWLREEYVNRLFAYHNPIQIEQVLAHEGEKWMSEHLGRQPPTFVRCIPHLACLTLALDNDERKQPEAIPEIIGSVVAEPCKADHFSVIFEHCLYYGKLSDVIIALKKSRFRFWSCHETVDVLLTRIASEAAKQGVCLSDFAEVWSHVIDNIVRHNTVGVGRLYRWLVEHDIAINTVSSEYMLRVLKEVHGMTPLQMIKTGDRQFEPFMKILVEKHMKTSKKGPLDLMDAVDPWVKPYLLPYLA